MPQGQRATKVSDPRLRAHVETLRRNGEAVNRKDVAEQFGCSVGTVQAVRTMVDEKLAAEAHVSVQEFTGGRLVQEFNGQKLYYFRKFVLFAEQAELAKMARVSRGEVGHLERGLRKPTLKTLRKLADALNVDYKDLTGKLTARQRLALSEGDADERRQTA